MLCSGPTPLSLGLGGLGRVSHEQHGIGGYGPRRLIVFAYRADLSPRPLTVVLDANIVVALVLDAKRATVIEQKLREWEEADEDLHAPSLFRYEVASGLTRSIVAGAIEAAYAKTAWQRIVAMPIALHGLDDGPAVIALARQLQRESAYDAAYVVLAQELEADGPSTAPSLAMRRVKGCQSSSSTPSERFEVNAGDGGAGPD